MPLPYKKGSNGPEIGFWQNWAYRYASSYAGLIGPKDKYYGLGEEAFTSRLQFNLHIPVTGVFGELEAKLTGYRYNPDGSQGTNPPQQSVSNEWIWTFPGSGADYWFGPSHDLGERCRIELGMNHQPVKFEKGGYLGFLGGNPEFSYLEVIWSQAKSLEWLWDNNPLVQKALTAAKAGNIEEAKRIIRMYLSGYSQSAEGAEEALVWLCTPGYVHIGDPTATPSEGKYQAIIPCIKSVVQFGNPSTHSTGIARRIRPDWLYRIIRNVNKPNDFYAVVPASDKIRPAFYRAIIEAEMELPFFVHCMMIALPIVMKWAATVIPVIGPIIGGMFGSFGPMMQMAMGMITGLGGVAQSPLMGQFMGMAGSGKDQHVHEDIEAILSPTGVLSNIPGLIGLIAALPGLQAHGMYQNPQDSDTAFNYIKTSR